MSVYIKWYNKHQTIVHLLLGENFTAQEFAQGVNEAHHMVSQKVHTVHILVEFRPIRQLPTGMLLTAGRMNIATPNLGWIMMVRPPAGLDVILGGAQRLIPNVYEHIQFADNMDAALEFLGSHV